MVAVVIEKKAKAAPIVLEWGDLVALEPRLRYLEQRCRDAKRLARGRRTWCSNAYWYGYGEFRGQSIRNQMSNLVGWDRDDGPSILKTAHAYDVAYEFLYALLPNCRNCMCM